MGQQLVHSQRLGLKQKLLPQQLQAAKLLEKSLPELRAEIAAQIALNPALEDVDHPMETSLEAAESEHEEENRDPDYPEEDFEPGHSEDTAAAERRQRFFDNQVEEETLQHHLSKQLPTSDIPESDRQLAEVLIGDLNDNGYYIGSLPDAAMAFDVTEQHVRGVLLKIAELHPAGCGAITARECLLAQLDKLDGTGLRDTVGKIVDSHLEDVAAGRIRKIETELGIDHDRYLAAMAALKSLEAHPGRAFPDEHGRVGYINPEVHAVLREGRWQAITDDRSLPEIKISPSFVKMLDNPLVDKETKAYVQERLAAAEAFRQSVLERHNTVLAVAQAIFDRQQDFFTRGFAALKPLTETEVAKLIGMDPSTVSRTVRDKYASTPRGTVELRRFFVSGVKTSAGEIVSQNAVLDALAKIVEGEDKSKPLSDERISALLKDRGFAVARRTVVKYRQKLKIPGTAERKE